ncbi:MAG: hypothetical protein ACFFAE_08720 [Candidatus Hodarchaeota archaeon]
MRTKNAILLILLGCLVLGFMPTLVRAQENPATSEDDFTSVMADEKIGNTEILVIQDRTPWGYDAISAALDEMGKADDYDVINSASLSTCDLSKYKIVILASCQLYTTYGNINTNIAKLDAFVSSGGVYICHACACLYIGEWYDCQIMPGMPAGAYVHAGAQSNAIDVVTPENPVIDGPYGELLDPYFDGWEYSTHGYFTYIPTGAIIVMETGGEPTYMDYNYGCGKVLTTMQTVEWGWSGVISWVGDYRKEFLKNEIAYAQVFQGCLGAPLFSDILAILPLGIVAGTMVIRRRRKLNP